MAETNEQDESPAESGSGSRKILSLLALLLGLGLGGAVGVMVVGPEAVSRLGSEPAQAAEQADDGGDHEEASEGERSEAPRIVVIDNLVVNPAASGGTRFLLTSVALSLGPDLTEEEVTAREVEIRDGLIRTLGAKTVSELSDMDLRPALIDEVHGVLEEVLGGRYIDQVFFPQFVIQ